ncbi:uncharacterized protein LOC133199059 [Saccostrea echinata]|uniref:uncharacterized protein LOC133199059 n=1 Tax=Saccostrea echinata TaxID=191078 RepID=UPI002A8300C9|nr:uncharacterized protein LOC133199059 [Saccostrea echinata]
MFGDQTLQVLIADSNDYMPPTKRHISSTLSIFRAFLLEKGLHLSVETTYSSEQLDALLTSFYMEMKKANGQHYARASVLNIRSGLQKYFLKLRNEDIIRSEKYSTSNKTFKEVFMKSGGKREVEFPKQKIPIHPNDVAKLYNTVFSTDSPRTLQQKTMFEFIYYFCDRGLDHMRRVRKEDFTFSRDTSGREYVTVRERYTKKNKKRRETIMQPVGMYDRPGDPMCPVASFKKYLMKLNPENPYFWQQPRKVCRHSDAIWYEDLPLGKKSFSALMMNLSVEANLSKKYCNSNIRTTNIQILDNQPEEAYVISAIIGCETDQSINGTTVTENKICDVPDILCENPLIKTFRNDAAAPSEPGHQDACVNSDNEILDNQSEEPSVISAIIGCETDQSANRSPYPGQQDSCVNSDNEGDTPIKNEYRNILFGEAANTWKQLIGQFDWLPDSEIAKHLIEVHEVYCLSKGICPLERTREAQNFGSIYRKRNSDGIPPREPEEQDDISLQLEVDEAADSVDEDSSGDSDLDLESEEEEPIYSMDNNSQNRGSTQQAENRVPHIHQESVLSWEDNLLHTSTVVRQEPVESYSNGVNTAGTNSSSSFNVERYSNAVNTTVTNVNSSASFKLASSGALSLPPSVSNDPVMRNSFTSSNIYESSSTHIQNTMDTPEEIENQTVNTKTSENIAQNPLLSTLITKQTLNSGTVEAIQVQKLLTLRLNSQGVISVDRQTDLSNSGPRGGTLYIQRGNTPNSVLVRPQDSGLFQPPTRNLLTTSKIQSSPGRRESFSLLPNLSQPSSFPCQPVFTSTASEFSLTNGGQETSLASSKILMKKEQQTSPASGVTLIAGGQQTSPASSVGGQQISPASGVTLIAGGQQILPASGVGGQQSLPASGVTFISGGQQILPDSGVGGQQSLPASGVTFITGGQQILPDSGVGGQQTPPASGVTFITGGQQILPDSGVGGQQTPPASGVTSITGGRQTSPASGVTSITGGRQTSPASGVTSITGGRQTSPASGVTSITGGRQTSPASGEGGQQSLPASDVLLLTGEQQASPFTGDLLIEGEKQTSFSLVSQTGLEQVDDGQEQIEKRDLPGSKKSKSRMYTVPPERPPNSFMLWLNAHRKKLRKQNPELGIIDFGRKAGEMWKALEDKTKWNKKAAEGMKEYKKDMEGYRAQKAERKRKAAAEEQKKLTKACRESVLSLRRRKIPKKSPSKSASENQAEPGTNYKSTEYASRSSVSAGSGSEDKPLKKKSKKEENSKKILKKN